MTSYIQALVAVSAFVPLSNVLLATFEPTSSCPRCLPPPPPPPSPPPPPTMSSSPPGAPPPRLTPQFCFNQTALRGEQSSSSLPSPTPPLCTSVALSLPISRPQNSHLRVSTQISYAYLDPPSTTPSPKTSTLWSRRAQIHLIPHRRR